MKSSLGCPCRVGVVIMSSFSILSFNIRGLNSGEKGNGWPSFCPKSRPRAFFSKSLNCRPVLLGLSGVFGGIVFAVGSPVTRTGLLGVFCRCGIRMCGNYLCFSKRPDLWF